MPWYRVACCHELPTGEGLRVETPGADLAIFWADGRPVAIDDMCLRCCASLASGTVNGSRVACWKCGWEYDLFTGAFTAIPALRLDVYEVEIADGYLYAMTNAGPEVPDAPPWISDPQRASGE